MIRSLSRVQAILLGAFVLMGLALIAAGLFAVGNRQWLWSDTFTVRVGFKQIRGVEVGTRVRVQGIDAGEVIAVDPPATPGRDVMLTLRIDGRLRHLLRADASAQIRSEGMVGGKVVEIDPGSGESAILPDHAILNSRPAPEMTELLGHVSQSLDELRKGEGTLGKLMKHDDMYSELVKLVEQARGTMSSLKQDVDAFQQLPIVRSYVKDPLKKLTRPDCERFQKTFKEAELFNSGQAVLTGPGKERLDELAAWLNELKPKGSEVVVAAYAQRSMNADTARIVTQKQSEAICDYLKKQHGVHKTGWFSRRDVTPLGCGVEIPSVPEKEKPPIPGVEVLVFVPQN